MSLLLWLLAVLPALAGLGLLATGASRVAGAVGVATGAVVFGLAVAAAVARPTARAPFVAGADLSLAVDALSALVLPVVAAVALLVLIFCVTSEPDHRARLFGFLLLFEAAVVVTVTATNLVTLLFAWEVMGATSYALIGLAWRERAPVDGGRTAFLTTRLADVGLYVAAGAALAGAGSLELTALPDASGGWRDLAALGIVVAALGKAAQLPFSFWLSKAMLGPSPVSALLHSAAMVAMGGYLLLRVAPLLSATGWAGPAVAWTGAATAVLLGFVAVAQTDLKQLLAASTCAQLGFVVLAAGSGAVSAGAIHLVAHAAVKSLLFLVAGVWLHAYGTRDLRELGGAARAMPWTGGCFVVGTLALAGLPPLSLWVSKDAVLAGALEQSPALYAAGLLGAALSAVYAGKALFMVLRPVAGEHLAVHRRPLTERTVLVVLGTAAVLAALLGLPAVEEPLREALGGSAAPGPVALAVSGALAVTGLLLTRRRPLTPLPLPSVASRWLELQTVGGLLVVRPVTSLARALAAADDRLGAGVGLVATRAGTTAGALARADSELDRAVTGTASATDRFARTAGRFDLAGLDGLVGRVTEATRGLGRLARRPQTGQLHTYYAQAAAVLAGSVLLLLLAR